jgi:hypothetical protein
MSLLECAVKSRQESANAPVIVAALLPLDGACAAGAAPNTARMATKITVGGARSQLVARRLVSILGIIISFFP